MPTIHTPKFYDPFLPLDQSMLCIDGPLHAQWIARPKGHVLFVSEATGNGTFSRPERNLRGAYVVQDSFVPGSGVKYGQWHAWH